MSAHVFDSEIAAKVGLNAAVVYQNILFWAQKNAADKSETHLHDGRYWTRGSAEAFAKLFPYLTQKQVWLALKRLEESGLVMSGEFNRVGYDRTKWYSPCGNSEIPLVENGDSAQGRPIPDITEDITADNKRARDELPLFSEDEQRQPKVAPSINLEDKFKEFYRVYPKKVAPDAAKRNFLRAVKAGADPDAIIAGAERYAKHVQAKGTERGYIKNPQGWLTDKRWEDEFEEARPPSFYRPAPRWDEDRIER